MAETLGLRERKKLRTRATIQREALRLFAQKGFQATTVEEIAAAAEVSPSTFFNYFPAKEDVVLQDDLDPLMLAAFNAQPAHLTPVAALRNAMREVLGSIRAEDRATNRQRIQLMATDADLRAATLNRFADLLREVAVVTAGRVGRDPDDFAVRNLSAAILGVFMAAMLRAADQPDLDLVRHMDEGLAHLEAGLPLHWQAHPE